MCSVEDVKRAVYKGAWFWKGDLADGYKQFYLETQAQKFMGMETSVGVYMDATVPMGWNGRPAWFSAFTYAVRDWLRNQGDDIFSFIDDFFGIAVSREMVWESLKRWLELLDKLGLSDKEKKRLLPAQIMVFLGLEWDSLAMEVRLPGEKKERLLTLLSSFVGRRCAKVAEIQKLAGKMGFAAQVVRGGWTHIRRVWDVYKGTTHLESQKVVKLGEGFHSDLQFWLSYLPVWNGVSTLEQPSSARFATDASKMGYGAWWGKRWLARAWSLSSRRNRHSNWKELACVLLAGRQWRHLWRGFKVEVCMNNQAAVAIINKGYSPVREYMRLARKIFWLAVNGDFELVAIWTPGVTNIEADALSRWLTDPSSSRHGESGLPARLPIQSGKERVHPKDLQHRSEGV